ncbi:MAG: hypothetical protein C0618_01430 [Desulfuromonas sp.]|nr:MAG: hypothetical protein C0618_01430 [Desulfuromonas sp.]
MMRSILFTTVLLAFVAVGSAFAIPCGIGGVTGAVDCQDGLLGSNNDFPAPDVVNAQTFFTFTDWEYLQKVEAPDGDGGTAVTETNLDYGWTVTPDGGWATSSGTWAFSTDVWNDFNDVMIVLKDGNIDNVYFSGYLLSSFIQPTAGLWNTGGRDISHLTLYARGGDEPPPIPEPGTIFLVAAGLAGIYGFRRKLNPTA